MICYMTYDKLVIYYRIYDRYEAAWPAEDHALDWSDAFLGLFRAREVLWPEQLLFICNMLKSTTFSYYKNVIFSAWGLARDRDIVCCIRPHQTLQNTFLSRKKSAHNRLHPPKFLITEGFLGCLPILRKINAPSWANRCKILFLKASHDR